MNVPATGTASGLRSQPSGRKNTIRLVMLAWAASLAKDKRTLPAVIVAAIIVVAVARLAREGGNPLDWYFAHGQSERGNRHNAEPKKG
jgi:hypothetical protein